MGKEKGETPTKTPKSTSSQDQPLQSPASVYPDWASFQAYYNSAGTPPLPPPAFFHSPVPSSPQSHPYMWGQHMMPPFGAPHPYVAMYPHGGLYGHLPIPPGSHPYAPYAMSVPNGTAEVSVPPAAGTELEGKSADGKRGTALNKSKESLGSLSTLTGKSYDMGKTSGASTDCGDSNSSNSENGTSSEGTDVNSQNGSHNLGFRQGSTDADEVQNGSAFVAMPASKQNSGSQTIGMMALPSNGMVPSATNLNIGMDFWGRSAAPAVAANHGKVAAVPSPPSIMPNNFMGARDGVSSDLWLRDEKEMKRQRRKQSNRESARRSRLRKQAECEELAQRVESLRQENSSLREELEQMRVDCQKLVEENTSLSEKLQKQEREQPVPDQEVEHTMED